MNDIVDAIQSLGFEVGPLGRALIVCGGDLSQEVFQSASKPARASSNVGAVPEQCCLGCRPGRKPQSRGSPARSPIIPTRISSKKTRSGGG
jgi:hypothetical protein